MELQKFSVQIFFEHKSNLFMDGKFDSFHLAVRGENLEYQVDQTFQP